MSASSKKQLRKEQNLAELTEKQLQEKKEAKKLKIYTISFVVVIALVICIGAGLLIRNTVVNSGIMQKTAAVKIGDHKLSAAELNYFYVDYIQETYNYWYERYGDMTDTYLTWFYGLNTAQALNTQYYDEEGQVTWAEFFANQAVNDAVAIYAVYDEAVANGFTLSEEDLASIDSNLQISELYAQMYGYTDMAAYLKAVYGPGSSVKSYREYVELTTLADNYYNHYSSSLSYTGDDYRTYETEHYDDFNSYTYSYFYVDADDFLTGGTEGEDGTITYSDEETAASVESAQAAAEALVNSGAASSAILKELIASTDPFTEVVDSEFYSKEDILYTSVEGISNVAAEDIQAWLSEDARQSGDITMFTDARTTTAEDGTESTTTYGYFVMILDSIDNNTMELVNVRHILVEYEGGTEDEAGNTVYSDEEIAAALAQAEALLETYNTGAKTEESFAELATENTDDTGSSSNGGLYEGVYPGQMVTNFNDWCFDESRQSGDVGIVETEYGYHVMYFVGTTGETFRDYMIDNTLRNNDVGEWYENLVHALTAENIKIKHLNLDYIINPS